MMVLLLLLSTSFAHADEIPPPLPPPDIPAPSAEASDTPLALPTVPLERRQCVSRLLFTSEIVAGSGLAMIGGAMVDSRHGGEFVAPLAVVGGSLSLGGLAMLSNIRPALRGDKQASRLNC